MIYTIKNQGNSRDIFYKGGMYFIPRNGILETDDRGLAQVASKFPFISFNDDVILRRAKKRMVEVFKRKK